MVWNEEMRWDYIRERGYEILDEVPDGWRVNDSSVEPRPFGLEWVCSGSLFGGEYVKALVRRKS